MPKYLIERNMPGAGKMSSDELKGASQTSNQVLSAMQKDGKNVQWVESYVTDDAIHCVYLAPDAEAAWSNGCCAGSTVRCRHQHCRCSSAHRRHRLRLARRVRRATACSRRSPSACCAFAPTVCRPRYRAGGALR